MSFKFHLDIYVLTLNTIHTEKCWGVMKQQNIQGDSEANVNI